MNPSSGSNSKITASLALAALIALTRTASATLVVATDHQDNAGPFTPSWPVTTHSLIANASPSTSAGNFTLESAGGLSKITDGAIGPVPAPVGNYAAPFATCGNGSGAGSTLIYTLASTGNGYNLTNITVFTGWPNGGRDAEDYNVSYSTVANPTAFIYLGKVDYNPYNGANESANRVMFVDSASGTIAANVGAIKFDFTAPTVEAGYAGVLEITMEGNLATSIAPPPPIVITSQNQSVATGNAPTWTIETDSLIAGQSPSAVGGGNFANEAGVTGTNALTDGTFGVVSGTAAYATCGASAGTSVTYALTQSVNGSDLTNIVVYSGWGNYNRDGQYYNVSYSTVTAPTTFIPLTSVFFNPQDQGTPSANRVAIATSSGAPLAQNVGFVKFDFTPQTGGYDNGYSGYAEIILEGTNSLPPTAPPSPYLTQDTTPSTALAVAGEPVVFTAAFSNTPAATLQWQVISGGTTNNVPGATSGTLTLASAQTTDSGLYVLKAVNATNSLGVSYSTPSSLIVSNPPAPVAGIITTFAAQTGSGSGNFTPTWTISPNNMILGQSPTSYDTFGNFNNPDVNPSQLGLAGGIPVLTDGLFGGILAGGTETNFATCGPGGPGNGAGQFVVYQLPTASSLGYDLTNIVVYGGWGDGGRDEQKYTVSYATAANPSVFIQIGGTVDFNPTVTGEVQSADRTMIYSTTGPLARNAAYIKFNWYLPSPPTVENGYTGYSELGVSGSPSAPLPVLITNTTPTTALDVVGSQVIFYATYSGATSYQWQKNGVNISGQTSPQLTLSNLQLSDGAGYSLLASNATGGVSSSVSTLVVSNVPAAVNNVIADIAAQTCVADAFTPTWDTSSLSSSLIYNQEPTASGTGNFTDPNSSSLGTAGGLPVLTDGTYGNIEDLTTTHPSLATCGSGAGQFVTYSLTGSANGYTITNIQIAGGWDNGGRDQQIYTVYYATAGNPTVFIPMGSVNYNPVLTDSPRSLVRATLTAATGALATNVVAVMVDFTTPAGGENGYSGYDEISVFGAPSTSVYAGLVIATANENTDAPDWVVETDSLIEGKLPTSTIASGSFAGGFAGEQGTEGLPALTDGTFGPPNSVSGLGNTNFATCGDDSRVGQSMTYTSTSGWILTNIVVYSGWANYNRDGQFYNVSYSTMSAPSTFIPLTSINYNPPALTGPSANRVDISLANGGAIATNVYAVTFDFSPQTGGLDNGYSGYAEIVLEGSSQAASIPPVTQPASISGTNLVLKATGGTPNRGYTWLSTTNLTAPLSTWTVGASGVLDGSGNASNAIPINVSQPASFYYLRMP